MARTSRKGNGPHAELEVDTMTARDREADLPAAARSIRKINPLGMRVVVQLQRESDRTSSGLYLPEGSKQMMSESILARVVEVASALDDESHQETNISGVPQDALVLIPQRAGVRVPWDDDLRIVETKEILAIVEEIEMI